MNMSINGESIRITASHQIYYKKVGKCKEQMQMVLYGKQADMTYMFGAQEGKNNGKKIALQKCHSWIMKRERIIYKHLARKNF